MRLARRLGPAAVAGRRRRAARHFLRPRRPVREPMKLGDVQGRACLTLDLHSRIGHAQGMNHSLYDPFQEFLTLVAPHRSRWRAVELRVLALREGDRFVSLITHAILRFPGERLAASSTVDLSKRLVAITHHETSTHLSDLLSQLKAGPMKLGGVQADYHPEAGRPPMFFFLYKFRRGDTYGPDSGR